MHLFGHNFFYLTLFQCTGFIGAPVLFLTNAPAGFCFGTVFYDASARKSCEAPVLYSNMMYRAGVYGAHGVWCANVLYALVLSFVESTGTILDDKRTEWKTSAKPSTRQTPLVTSARNECMGYFYKEFLENIC